MFDASRLYVPAGHSVGGALLTRHWYPAGQSVQVVAEPKLYVPEGHGVSIVSVQDEPAEQAVQDSDPAELKNPYSQVVSIDDPAGQ